MKILSLTQLSQIKQSECGTVHFLCLDSYRTLYDTPQQCQMLVLSTKPLQNLTGKDGQTGRQAYVQGGCDSKNFIDIVFNKILKQFTRFSKRLNLKCLNIKRYFYLLTKSWLCIKLCNSCSICACYLTLFRGGGKNGCRHLLCKILTRIIVI